MADQPAELASTVDLLVADLNGAPRGKTVQTDALDDGDPPHFVAAAFFQTITGDYSEGCMERFDPKDEDLILRPDWSSYSACPWRPGDHGQVVCDALDKSGALIPYDSRNVLKRVLAVYADADLHPVVAPELEFYLLEPVQGDASALALAPGVDGRAEFGGEAFSVDALDKYAPFLDDVKAQSEAAGLPVSAFVHEVGPAQIELNLAHGDPLRRADQLFLLKRLVKACAVRHGYLASFMARPLDGVPGSGAHLHCSVADGTGGNIFALEDGRAPAALRHFIGGLQTWLPEAFALIAPNVNSFKRLVPDLSAPINLEWGYDNRTAGLRVPYGPPASGRVENRVAGADVNPYLLTATTLACGWLGMQDGAEPTQPHEGDAYQAPATLPNDLSQALSTLAASRRLADLLSEAFIEVYVDVKRSELQDFQKWMTPWEMRYLGSQL
ncbi:MAG: glutamine synthetase family protein [Gammaproteobacteria bacterium]|nr:glutamine synthetase family protein [Gammaproteobacteria bacterium]